MGAILSRYQRQLRQLWQRADSSELVALAAGIPLLVFQFIHPLISWKTLFRRVPVLFDLHGYPSKMGQKWTLFIVPSISLFIAHEYVFAPGLTKLFTVGDKRERVSLFLFSMLLTSYYATSQVRTGLAKQSTISTSMVLSLLSAAASSLFYALWSEAQGGY